MLSVINTAFCSDNFASVVTSLRSAPIDKLCDYLDEKEVPPRVRNFKL